MKKYGKKILKIIALVTAVILIVVVCWFANALCGNPVSHILARRAAETWLRGRFPNSDYYVEDVRFNFKDTNYYAYYRSKSSMDTQFTLYINMFGQGYYDTYESVLNGSVTARRLNEEYMSLTDQIFESSALPGSSDLQFGMLEIYPQEAISNPLVTDVPDYALVQEDLILDKIYDIRELGALAGHLVIYVDRETVTYELAAKILLDIRAEFDRANIPFHAITFILQYPRSDEGIRPEGRIRVEEFLYEDIYEEGLTARIETADAALKAYYAVE